MTHSDIIKLAREADIDWHKYDAVLVFASLVAAHEREACAKFVEDEYVRQFDEPWRQHLARSIRARGQA
jgi:menaquinone-dependent protoporphyrinogen IX oxidase